ncbi:hypothetical protein [Bacteroides acidifaciens]|uniref:Uncharacterized protein n=1 Tax=Bacteroides acidifaciens TaxID=85831 RepID=A0A7K3MFC9_9BACE|nr:hypothetical protein [Bacteroides acidifaciens]MBF0728815.1 hypothetical protein [Bacteroides acidifaciens]MBF0834785.1 hypothetical protein [Bacteroides acidifaciens]NDO53198.1 hypothetical protein [Bacteroides acidifaciens]TFU51497.1 hypothetical protein E4T97_04380 [Bacteroides acidifaciens]
MNAQLLIKFIIGLAIIALILTNKIVPYLRDKLFMNISKSGYFRIILAITVVSVFGVAFNNYQESKQKYTVADNEKVKKERLIRNAFEASKNEVKLQLKSPSTAKFATEFDDKSKYKINDDESVIIQSYVDAQNSFGATIRTHFRCTVDKYGNVNDLATW